MQNSREAAGFLEGERQIPHMEGGLNDIFNQTYDEEIVMATFKGQESVRRALEIAAASGHNVLLLHPIFPRPQNPPNNGLTFYSGSISSCHCGRKSARSVKKRSTKP